MAARMNSVRPCQEGDKTNGAEMRVDQLICQYLDWDSTFFGRRIARAASHRLDRESVENILHWCKIHRIDCLYFLSSAEDDLTVRLAEENRFHLVDIRVVLEKSLSSPARPSGDGLQNKIRLSTPADIPGLRKIARESYHTTRFHYDSNFPAQLAGALYETWIEKSCLGSAEAVFVAEIEQQAAGYISCHLKDNTLGEIGLVGVSAEFSNQGLGQALVSQALDWFASQNALRVAVATQARNHKAIRLYERCGFLTSSVNLWYHRWFQSSERK